MAGLPFLSGADINLPATTPPSGSIRVVAAPRGGGPPNVINLPAWPSTTNHSTVQLRDFTTPAGCPSHCGPATAADRPVAGGVASVGGRTPTVDEMPVRAVTFDADDTLWDFTRARDDALALAIAVAEDAHPSLVGS